jgi:hypothetical protein
MLRGLDLLKEVFKGFKRERYWLVVDSCLLPTLYLSLLWIFVLCLIFYSYPLLLLSFTLSKLRLISFL